VRITTWPDWVSSIPTVDQRLDLKIAVPAASPDHASPGTSPSVPGSGGASVPGSGGPSDGFVASPAPGVSAAPAASGS
jgi:hypothetical protein